jgi:glutamate racemase
MPQEHIIYFGDTAHLPYGEKSTAALQSYTVKSIDLLLKNGVKAIVIACNSASAAAYDLACAYVGSHAHVINVIDPVAEYVAGRFNAQKIGLIGTRQTVNSGVYERKLREKNDKIQLRSLSTPLLASAIEEGFFDNKVSLTLIEQYLSNPILSDIEALILACTHYPLIKKQIESFYGGKTEVIDGSWLVAEQVLKVLTEKNLLNDGMNPQKDRFIVSDLTESFAATTEIFFRKRVDLELYKLWE